MAIFSIRNFAIKRLMKAGDDGIMKMPSNMKADFAEAMLTKQLIDAGIDPRTIKNEQQLINVLDGIDDMKKKMAELAIKEKTGITSAKIMDMEGKEIPKGSKIMGGKATETEAEIAARMNKENKESVARIKNKKLIDDAIDNVSIGFSGDRRTDAELVAAEIAERRGLNVDDLSTRERAKIYGEAYEALTKKKFDPDNMAQGGRVGLFKGAQADASAGKGSMSPGTDTKGNVRDDNPFTGGGNNNNQPPSPPTKDTKQKTPVVANPIKNLRTHFANNQKLKNAVALGLITNDEYNVLGGYDAQQTLGMGPIDTGLSSLAYNVVQSFKGDQPFGDIFGDVARNVKGASSISPELQSKYENIMQMADGGRIGLKDGMDRRTFMKIMAGLASIPVVGKFFKGAKVASKAAPVAMESATRSEAPTYFLKLVDKITKQGKPVTSTEDIMETYIYTAKNGDSYELVNDLKTGDLRITKDKIGVGSYGDKTFDTIEDRTIMEYKAPRQDVDVETGKGTREAPEYEEYKVEFDADGTEAGAEAIEETVQKEIIEESAEEAPSIKKADGGRVGLLSGGGILRTILTNLAKDKGMKPSDYLRLTNYKSLPDSTKRIISKDEFLRLKSDMTEKRIELMDTVKNMIVTRQGFEKSKDDLRKSMNMASEGYGDKAVKMMFPEDKFPSPVPAGSGQKDVMMMEQLIKNLKTKDRQLNASGGVAYMLGE